MYMCGVILSKHLHDPSLCKRGHDLSDEANIRRGGGNSRKPHTVFFLCSQPPEGGGGYANFFLTHMTKNFTKQSHFKAKVDLLTPSLHQCEDYDPGSTCKAW